MENVLHSASAKKKGFNQTGFLTVKPIGLGNLISSTHGAEMLKVFSGLWMRGDFAATYELAESFWWLMGSQFFLVTYGVAQRQLNVKFFLPSSELRMELVFAKLLVPKLIRNFL